MSLRSTAGTALVGLVCLGMATAAEERSPAAAAAAAAAGRDVRGALIQDGEPPSLVLLYTGDVIGFLDPCG